ncbi:MAG: ice-binding family protein [Eubacteriales bacterium]|nr:ice-binding family protein [Eubacteriales bacterium]
MFKRATTILLTIMLGLMMITPAMAMAAELPINLGSAENFAILAHQTITNIGNTTINGDVGLYPGTSVTGFETVTLNGTLHLTDTTAMNAKADLLTAFNDAAGRTTTTVITPADLGGRTLTPGVYTAATSIGLTGTLILDGGGDSNAVFIFKAGSALTTASNSEIKLINGASASNVFWQIGSSATLGTNSKFVGNIMAQDSITLTTGVELTGKIMALTGSVTLDSDVILNENIVEPEPTTYSMSIVKTADATEIEVGDTINYRIAVTNTGVATLNDITVTDEMIGLDETITTLAVGDSSIFTGSYVALTPGVLTNTANASDDQASYVVDSVSTTVVADVDVPVVPIYRMSITKTANTNEVTVGDTVSYRIIVTNTGNATLNSISVTDTMIGLNGTITTLSVGDSSVFTGSYLALTPGLLTNTAYASDDQAPDVMDTVATTVVATVVVPVVPEEEITVPIPDTNAASPIVFYGMGALMVYAGYVFLNKKKDLG